MVTYLLVISLIIHLGTILWIVVLMQKINQFSFEIESIDADKVTREIEHLLVAYTAEMKAENERLIKELFAAKRTNVETEPTIQRRQQNGDSRNVNQKEMVEPRIFNETSDEQQKKVPNHVEKATEEGRFSDYEPPSINETQSDVFEQSDTLKVLTLAKQGLKVDDIAKKLNMGKGEVELLLKFYQ